jgi:hypothetical protein
VKRCRECISADVFDCLFAGLGDQHDIKLIALLALSHCAAVAPRVLSQSMSYCHARSVKTRQFNAASEIERLCDTLHGLVTAQPKPGAVKQETERNDEVLRAALSTVASLAQIRGAGLVFYRMLTRSVYKYAWKHAPRRSGVF